jgi:hypothetical protein
LSRTGFSREEASAYTLYFAAWPPTLSRLKPVPRGYAVLEWDWL